MNTVQPGASPANPAPRVPPGANSLAAKYQRLAPNPIIAAAEAFIAIGGRLMINPHGMFEEAINLNLIFGSDLPLETAQANCDIASAFTRVMRRRGAVLSLKALVRRRGTATANGWIVLRAQS